MTITPSDVLDFWFDQGPSIRRSKWFEKSDDFDLACSRFVPEIRAARDGAYDGWALMPKTALALIVLLDQLPRNVFRGQAEAFAGDVHALGVADTTVACHFDTKLTAFERMFVYLPFEHAEAMEAQEESVRLFENLRPELGSDTVDYAYRHRDVIKTFGRFPHRNAILGRTSTQAEEDYLSSPGAGF